MPYALTLQQYTPPEFYRQAPEEWVRRLREIAPERADMDHLVFRCFDPLEPNGDSRGWKFPDKPIWTLYAAKPIRLVEIGRAQQFDRHWSELPQAEQEGRKAVVSDYQHFMWHSQGLYVKPFLILQGPYGGTPAQYTDQEKAFLKASSLYDEPFPIGMLPACPFDERVVKQISMRDRLLRCANRVEALAKLDTAEGKLAEEKAAEQVFRETYLDTFKVMIQPSVDFYGHFIRRSENRESLPAAPADVKDNIGSWREHWLQHGVVKGAKIANTKQIR